MRDDDILSPSLLAEALESLADLLGLEREEVEWVAGEFGSSCADSLRADLACQAVHWLNETLERYFFLDASTAAKVMKLGATLKPVVTMAETVYSTSQFELVHTAPLSCEHVREVDAFRAFAALALKVDKPENHGFGYHLHPLDTRGKHLGYKLLFDPKLGQRWLSWEAHGQGATPWGLPPHGVLGVQRSEQLHSAALRSVRGSVIAPKGSKFAVWASYFETPGRTAYVAAPPVEAVLPWPSGGPQR